MLDLSPSPYPAYAAECGDPSRTKKLGFGTRPAILFLDVCDVYCSPSSPLVLPENSLKSSTTAITALLQAVRKAEPEPSSVPVIFAQTYYTHPKLRDAGLAAQKSAHAVLFSQHHPAKLVSFPTEYSSIRPLESDLVLKKKYPSAFFGTNFATQLAALGVDTLLIAGFTTSVNIRASALDAMQSGFRPVIVAEACADRGEETHWANLLDLNAKYGDVIRLEEARSYLESVCRDLAS